MNGAFETSGIVDVVFWVVSALAIGGAVLVVTVKNLFRAALFLAGTFLAVAAIYFLLSAEFIGVVQILVYVGAVSLLLVFAVLMVRDVPGGARRNRMFHTAATVAVLMAVAVGFVAYNTEWRRIEDVSSNDVAVADDATAALVGTYRPHPVVRDGVTGAELFEARPDEGEARPGVLRDSTGTIGELLIQDYLLPFQVIGVYLVAVLIGALVLVREGRRR